MNYVHGSRFVVFFSGLSSANCIHMIQGYFTGIVIIVRLPQEQWTRAEEYV